MTVHDVWYCLDSVLVTTCLVTVFNPHWFDTQNSWAAGVASGSAYFLWFSWSYAKYWPSICKAECPKIKTQGFCPIATLPRTLNFTSKFARYGSRSGIHGVSVVRVYLVKAPQCHISLCIVCAIIYWKFRMLIPINMKIYENEDWNIVGSEMVQILIQLIISTLWWITSFSKHTLTNSRHLDPTTNNSKQPPMGRGHNGKHPSGNIRRCLFDGFWLGHVGSNGI